ncbi:factor-independent urate hydroxylase [Actinomadura mexicana]|uniref:Uricase n=1 Tax=Actinomadura mexicana TaxID=134959 RepID=A0A239BA13_9ACTN|nr:urate oxidase [Actinomadura mexicana]SNS04452.1 urate oxidase [Actinomadura mexicana]
MAIVLGPNRYGKAETRVVRVTRDGGTHRIKDLNVSVALSGAMDEVHLTGDNAAVLPTDTQKNTVYAFAGKHGIGTIEDFGLLLARHFVDSRQAVAHARVEIREYGWRRITGGHSFVRDGGEVRTALVHCGAGAESVVSGLTDLVVLNSTGSEFHGFARDEYTTLEPTDDRILATAVTAQWRHRSTAGAWDDSYAAARDGLLRAFAETHSLSLQQTLYQMGRRVLDERTEICEVRLSLPNKHHFLVDLEPFGMDNDNEVYLAADRPYGLIEGTVLTDDAPAAPAAFD